jgi:hypothetical protein
MGASDDFAEWEEELAGSTKPANDRGMIIIALILMAGSGLLIALDVIALGIAALVVLALILILWRAGM